MSARPLQRVVYVVSLFPCWSETFIVREIKGLLEHGVDVRIVSLKRPCETLVQEEAAAMISRVRHPGSLGSLLSGLLRAFFRDPLQVLRAHVAMLADGWRKPSVVLKSVFATWRGLEHTAWLEEFDPQVIHAHWGTYPSTAAWAMAAVLGKPFGFTCHAHDIFVDKQLLARKISESALAVTISDYNVQWLQDHVCDQARARLRVVHCGADLDSATWSHAGREAGTVLAVGRLDPIKGFATLIEALALLDQRGVAYRCTLVGSGPLDDALRRLAEDRGVAARITFAGAQPQAVVREYMATSSVFVLPAEVAADGNRDGIPVALMEAMAFGCPVVSTAVSGIPELVRHDITGLVVAPGDAAGLSHSLELLLQQGALAERLSRAARVQVEDAFDSRKEASRLLHFMEEIADAA